MKFISHAISCLALQEEEQEQEQEQEPQTAYPMSMTWASHIAVPCWWENSLTNQTNNQFVWSLEMGDLYRILWVGYTESSTYRAASATGAMNCVWLPVCNTSDILYLFFGRLYYQLRDGPSKRIELLNVFALIIQSIPVFIASKRESISSFTCHDSGCLHHVISSRIICW